MSEVPLYAHALHAASGGVISPFLCLTGWKESGSVQIVELTESVLGLTELWGLNVAGVVRQELLGPYHRLFCWLKNVELSEQRRVD